jgi:hypothetical protein
MPYHDFSLITANHGFYFVLLSLLRKADHYCVLCSTLPFTFVILFCCLPVLNLKEWHHHNPFCCEQKISYWLKFIYAMSDWLFHWYHSLWLSVSKCDEGDLAIHSFGMDKLNVVFMHAILISLWICEDGNDFFRCEVRIIPSRLPKGIDYCGTKSCEANNRKKQCRLFSA